MSAQEKWGFAAPLMVFIAANLVSFTLSSDVVSY